MITLIMAKHLLLVLFFVVSGSYQQQLQLFESSIQLTEFGTAFQPRNPIELLGTFSNIRSLLRCAMQCNQNRQCRTFDYDQSSLVCRQFEGEFSTGTVLIGSSLSSSRIGSILYNTSDTLEQYASYNQTCNQCGIGINRYLQCINNTCQCPPNTYWNGQMCSNQLYSGSSCNCSSACRQDLNLTCSNQTKTCTVSTLEAWSYTGGMNSTRAGHTASLLPDGTVLIVGGEGNGGVYLNSVELYDPSTGVWRATGWMNRTRELHTASILSNGTVLVTGGWNGSALNSADLYDPLTGIWRATGGMNSTREWHTALVLPNGTVLVTGGDDGIVSLNSAELYDPLAGVWRATGGMNSTRRCHTASILLNGTVLVVGGEGNGGVYLNSAELYDPSTGVWRATGWMNSTRRCHTASLLPNGTVLVVGGEGNGGVYLNSVELYDPSTGVWRATGGMNSTRVYHTASLLPNGTVLVAGGERNGTDVLNSAELYHPF